MMSPFMTLPLFPVQSALPVMNLPPCERTFDQHLPLPPGMAMLPHQPAVIPLYAAPLAGPAPHLMNPPHSELLVMSDQPLPLPPDTMLLPHQPGTMPPVFSAQTVPLVPYPPPAVIPHQTGMLPPCAKPPDFLQYLPPPCERTPDQHLSLPPGNTALPHQPCTELPNFSEHTASPLPYPPPCEQHVPLPPSMATSPDFSVHTATPVPYLPPCERASDEDLRLPLGKAVLPQQPGIMPPCANPPAFSEHTGPPLPYPPPCERTPDQHLPPPYNTMALPGQPRIMPHASCEQSTLFPGPVPGDIPILPAPSQYRRVTTEQQPCYTAPANGISLSNADLRLSSTTVKSTEQAATTDVVQDQTLMSSVSDAYVDSINMIFCPKCSFRCAGKDVMRAHWFGMHRTEVSWKKFTRGLKDNSGRYVPSASSRPQLNSKSEAQPVGKCLSQSQDNLLSAGNSGAGGVSGGGATLTSSITVTQQSLSVSLTQSTATTTSADVTSR